jgi:LPS sulfotransferase NodH
LAQHTDIYWAREIFNLMRQRHPDVALGPEALGTIIGQSRLTGRHTGKTFYGFELKYLPQQHLRFVELTLDDCVNRLRGLGFSKFIVLRRENYLRQAISVQIGKHKKHWHGKATPDAATQVVLELESFRSGRRTASLLEVFDSIDDNFLRVKQLLEGDDVLHLSYEQDIFDDPMKAYRKCCRFLGITPQTPKIHLAKSNPFPYEAMVANMPAVSALLRDTKYAWMLDA